MAQIVSIFNQDDKKSFKGIRTYCDQRLLGMRSDRLSYFNHWRELSQYILPRRGRYLITPNQGNRGTPRNQSILDNTGTKAARTLANGMMAGITSPARPWFKLTISGRKDGVSNTSPVKIWLDSVEQVLMAIFQKSNFYTSLATIYEEIGIFGTAAMIIYEDFEDVIRCYPLTAGEYYLANDNRNDCNTLYREFTMTVGQLVQKFGLESCSPTVQSLYRTGTLDKEVLVCHAIEPNDKRIVDAPGTKGFKYRDVYWEWGSSQDCILQLKGYNELPFCGFRWHLVGNDVYGRSPAMEALPDIKQLQLEQKRKAQAIDKHVNPPLMGDPSLRNEPVSALPGGITFVATSTNGIGLKPIYEVMPQIQELMEDIKETQQRVSQTFYADLWLMMNEMEGVQPRNEMEITERKGEQLLQLGPVLERVQGELSRAIERTFNIAKRAGILPPPPQELKNANLDIEYISMLAQAQKSVATTGIEKLVAFVGNLAAAKPQALDKIDEDEIIDEYSDMLGVSPKVVIATAQANKDRAARAKQQAAQAATQQSLAAVQGAKTLGDTDVGGGQNALAMMMGNAPTGGVQ